MFENYFIIFYLCLIVVLQSSIRVGGRVRDIAYRKSKNQFLLYLEDISKVMILKSKN